MTQILKRSLHSALTVAQGWTAAGCAWLGFFDPGQKRLIPRFGVGIDLPGGGHGLPREEGAFRFYYETIERQKPRTREIAGIDGLCYPKQMGAEAAYPLVLGSEPIGILVLATEGRFRSWSSATPEAADSAYPQKDLLTLLARVIAFVEMQDRVASRARHLEEQLLTKTILLLNGLLSAHLAHEVTAGLDEVVGALSTLVTKRTLSELEQKLLAEQVQRLRDIALLKHQLLFSRTPLPSHFSVNALVLREQRALERSAFHYKGRWDASHGEDRRVQLRPQLDERLDKGRGHEAYSVAAYVRLILRNLVMNGVEASRAGGTVTVATEWDEKDHKHPIVLRVSDDGEGIPFEVKHRIFEPFYSTKQGGFGIGLALVKELVGVLGCPLDVLASPGRGTTFVLRLPQVA